MKLAFAYFLAHHEGLAAFNPYVPSSPFIPYSAFNKPDSRDKWLSSPYCNSTHGSYAYTTYKPISDCHDLGLLIPKEVSSLIAALPLEIFGRLVSRNRSNREFQALDPANKFYYEFAALFCNEWGNFRWQDSPVK